MNVAFRKAILPIVALCSVQSCAPKYKDPAFLQEMDRQMTMTLNNTKRGIVKKLSPEDTLILKILKRYDSLFIAENTPKMTQLRTYLELGDCIEALKIKPITLKKAVNPASIADTVKILIKR